MRRATLAAAVVGLFALAAGGHAAEPKAELCWQCESMLKEVKAAEKDGKREAMVVLLREAEAKALRIVEKLDSEYGRAWLVLAKVSWYFADLAALEERAAKAIEHGTETEIGTAKWLLDNPHPDPVTAPKSTPGPTTPVTTDPPVAQPPKGSAPSAAVTLACDAFVAFVHAHPDTHAGKQIVCLDVARHAWIREDYRYADPGSGHEDEQRVRKDRRFAQAMREQGATTEDAWYPYETEVTEGGVTKVTFAEWNWGTTVHVIEVGETPLVTKITADGEGNEGKPELEWWVERGEGKWTFAAANEATEESANSGNVPRPLAAEASIGQGRNTTAAAPNLDLVDAACDAMRALWLSERGRGLDSGGFGLVDLVQFPWVLTDYGDEPMSTGELEADPRFADIRHECGLQPGDWWYGYRVLEDGLERSRVRFDRDANAGVATVEVADDNTLTATFTRAGSDVPAAPEPLWTGRFEDGQWTFVQVGGQPTQDGAADPAASADGPRIAFAERQPRSLVWCIQTVRPDGANRRELTRFTANSVDDLAASPDGRLLAFQARGETDGLLVCNAQTGAMFRLGDLQKHGPSWAPDSQRLVTMNGGPLQVWTADGEMHSASPFGSCNAPAWSPTRDEIAYLKETGYTRCDVAVTGVDFADERRVTNLRTLSVFGSVSWSPDGTRIAFVHGDEPDVSQLYIVARDGTDLTRLTNMPDDVSTPVWSPDGRSIAFIHRRPTAEMWVVGSDGTGARKLAPITLDGSAMAWSPDSAQLAFRYDRGEDDDPIAVVQVGEAGVTHLTNGDRWATNPVWLAPSGPETHSTGPADLPVRRVSVVPRPCGCEDAGTHGDVKAVLSDLIEIALSETRLASNPSIASDERTVGWLEGGHANVWDQEHYVGEKLVIWRRGEVIHTHEPQAVRPGAIQAWGFVDGNAARVALAIGAPNKGVQYYELRDAASGTVVEWCWNPKWHAPAAGERLPPWAEPLEGAE